MSDQAPNFSFSQRNIGDVLVTFENEANYVSKKLTQDQFEIVYPSYTIISYLNDKMSAYFAQHDVTSARFHVFGKLLPELRKDIAWNICTGLITHFLKPVYNIAECAEIIIANQDFYLYVLNVGKNVAQPILKEMLTSEMYNPIHSKIATLINDDEEDSSKNNT